MSPVIQAFLILEIFRLACVAAGCLLAYLGYRLFRLGVYEKQGELKASYGSASLALRQVGPGIFFALFGLAMAYTGFIRKFEAGPVVQTSLATDTSGTQVENGQNASQANTVQPVPAAPSPGRPKAQRTSAENTAHDQSSAMRGSISTSAGPSSITLSQEQLQKLKEAIKLTNSISKQQVVPR